MDRLNPASRAFTYLAAWFFLQVPVDYTLDLIFATGAQAESGIFADFRLLQYVSQAIVVVVLTWCARRYWDRAPVHDLGFTWTHRAQHDLVAGLLIGGFGMGLLALVELANGWLYIEGLAPNMGQNLPRGLCILALMAFSEETVFRGYMLQNLEKAWGMTWAFVSTSVLFGLMHLPATTMTGPTPILVLLSVTLSGFVFAAAYYARRNLWLPIGLHFGWDLVQISLGADSGWALGGPIVLEGHLCGPAQWVGCHAGVEVGMLGWISMLLMFLLVQGYSSWRATRMA